MLFWKYSNILLYVLVVYSHRLGSSPLSPNGNTATHRHCILEETRIIILIWVFSFLFDLSNPTQKYFSISFHLDSGCFTQAPLDSAFFWRILSCELHFLWWLCSVSLMGLESVLLYVRELSDPSDLNDLLGLFDPRIRWNRNRTEHTRRQRNLQLNSVGKFALASKWKKVCYEDEIQVKKSHSPRSKRQSSNVKERKKCKSKENFYRRQSDLSTDEIMGIRSTFNDTVIIIVNMSRHQPEDWVCRQWLCHSPTFMLIKIAAKCLFIFVLWLWPSSSENEKQKK